LIYTTIESALGELLLTSRDGKLTGLYFADQSHAPRLQPDWVRQDDAPIFAHTAQQLAEYASGKRKTFDLSKLGLAGTPMQVDVWMKILEIPFGKTITYSELAERVGSPDAVRAVGGATGRNPISWIVPCHRVMGKSGALTGYAGGLARKTALLDFESGKSAVLSVKVEQPLAVA
jgi:methylated-DNA-[protein]-cysteine S-methyltransferase